MHPKHMLNTDMPACLLMLPQALTWNIYLNNPEVSSSWLLLVP